MPGLIRCFGSNLVLGRSPAVSARQLCAPRCVDARRRSGRSLRPGHVRRPAGSGRDASPRPRATAARDGHRSGRRLPPRRARRRRVDVRVEMLGFAPRSQEITIAGDAPASTWELKLLPFDEITRGRRRRARRTPSAPADAPALNDPRAPGENGPAGVTAARRSASRLSARAGERVRRAARRSSTIRRRRRRRPRRAPTAS